eukprot:s933_g8.t1
MPLDRAILCAVPEAQEAARSQLEKFEKQASIELKTVREQLDKTMKAQQSASLLSTAARRLPEISAPVWVRVTGEEVWKAGFVKSLQGDDLTIEVQASGARARREDVVLSVKKEPPAFCKRNPELLKADRAAAMDDLSLLSLLNEPELLHAIESRFARDVIYTSTGPVLLAVNPFRTLPRLYDSDCLNTFLSTEEIMGDGAGRKDSRGFVMRYLALAGSGGSEASGFSG